MPEIILSLSYALQISGTALLASKIIGINRNKIMDRATGTSITIILNKKKEPFIMKDVYNSILSENLIATFGLIGVVIGIIINILNSQIEYNKLCVIILSIILSVIIYLLTKYISNKLIGIYTKKWKKYIKLDIVPNGATAISIDLENEKE